MFNISALVISLRFHSSVEVAVTGDACVSHTANCYLLQSIDVRKIASNESHCLKKESDPFHLLCVW